MLFLSQCFRQEDSGIVPDILSTFFLHLHATAPKQAARCPLQGGEQFVVFQPVSRPRIAVCARDAIARSAKTAKDAGAALRITLLMVQSCTSRSRYRATGSQRSQWSTVILTSNFLVCNSTGTSSHLAFISFCDAGRFFIKRDQFVHPDDCNHNGESP